MLTLIKFGIPILAAAALGFGIASTIILKPQDQLTAPDHPPAITTLGPQTAAGLGEIQSRGEAVAIAAPVNGLVSKVQVVAGDQVSRGQVLFELDDRSLRAQLALAQRQLATAQARLERLRAMPRPEDLPPMRARVAVAKVAVDRAQDLFDRGQVLITQGAIGQEEVRQRDFSLRQAQVELVLAEAELARLVAGTWQPEIAIAERERDEAAAQVDAVQTELDRLVIRSPEEGTVLRVQVREGEMVVGDMALGPAGSQPPILLARRGPLEVRVQVDEEDASRILPGAMAEGFMRGRDRTRVELKFLRIEPRVVPKTSITGAALERVDTRVLFVVYEVLGSPQRIYPGQKMDVFIEVGK